MPVVWYRVRDLAAARRFYVETLEFTETEADEEAVKLRNGDTEIALVPGEPEKDGGVAHVDVEDVKAEAERLRAAGVEVGVVLELHGEMRLLDVFDPDGNRIQLGEDVSS